MPRTVLITGANRGIGLGFARYYSELGWNVIATSRKQVGDDHELRQLAHTTVFELDVSEPNSIGTCAEQVQEFIAQSRIEGIQLLINNAGIGVSDHGHDGRSTADPSALTPQLVVDMPSWSTADNLMGVLKTNVAGPMLVTQAFLPMLTKYEQEPAAVVNVGSLVGSIGDNSHGAMNCYRISKAALNMLTKNFALEQRDVVFLVVHPGMVGSDMGIVGEQILMGGQKVTVPVKESIDAMYSNILSTKLTQENSGKFFGFDGQEIAW